MWPWERDVETNRKQLLLWSPVCVSGWCGVGGKVMALSMWSDEHLPHNTRASDFQLQNWWVIPHTLFVRFQWDRAKRANCSCSPTEIELESLDVQDFIRLIQLTGAECTQTLVQRATHMGKNDSLSALLYPAYVALSSSGIMSKQDVNLCTYTFSRASNFFVCCGRSFDIFNLRLSVQSIIATARGMSAVSQQHLWTATLSHASVVRCFQALFSTSVLIPVVLRVLTHQL